MTRIDEQVLDLFRRPGRCELCGKDCNVREPHHVTTRGHGGGSRLDVVLNLVGLCPGPWGCHQKHGDDPKYLKVFMRIVARREGLPGWVAVRNAIWRLRQQPKEMVG